MYVLVDLLIGLLQPVIGTVADQPYGVVATCASEYLILGEFLGDSSWPRIWHRRFDCWQASVPLAAQIADRRSRSCREKSRSLLPATHTHNTRQTNRRILMWRWRNKTTVTHIILVLYSVYVFLYWYSSFVCWHFFPLSLRLILLYGNCQENIFQVWKLDSQHRCQYLCSSRTTHAPASSWAWCATFAPLCWPPTRCAPEEGNDRRRNKRRSLCLWVCLLTLVYGRGAQCVHHTVELLLLLHY